VLRIEQLAVDTLVIPSSATSRNRNSLINHRTEGDSRCPRLRDCHRGSTVIWIVLWPRIALSWYISPPRLRKFAGWGWAHGAPASSSSVGFGFKLFPYETEPRKGISVRGVTGISFSKFQANGQTVFGISESRRVVALNFGAELVTPTFLDVGLGFIVPINPWQPQAPLYTRLKLKL